MADATVRITIDGKELSVAKGINIVEAAKIAQVEVPHYCYHKRLSIAGNCRMCLVDVGMPKLGPDKKPEIGADGKPVIAFGPKLAIGCNTQVAEGMVIHTRSPKVTKAREGVMEFLLINHPLDCPICDQAGECRLQEFAVDYGKGASRFIEQKEKKPKRVPLGKKIMLDDERCILCSRCVRFMKEVAKQDCLGFVQRGSRSILTCYPGLAPNSNYDLNVVDICPVGALTSTDFRFRQRVWFLKETRSICPGCSNGCNIVIGSRENVIHRFTPRDNDDVNQSWMCDQGRLDNDYINDPKRLVAPRVDGRETGWQEALDAASARLMDLKGRVAVIASARLTTEELHLVSLVAAALGPAKTDIVPRQGEADGYLLKADRNPNTNGAILTGVAAEPPGSVLMGLADQIRSGAVAGLLVVGENIAQQCLPADVLAKLSALVVVAALPSPTTDAAQVLLPGATFAEKRGTFINGKGRIQKINPAILSPGLARTELQILTAMLSRVGGRVFGGIDDVFADLAKQAEPLHGLTLGAIPETGVALTLKAAQGVGA